MRPPGQDPPDAPPATKPQFPVALALGVTCVASLGFAAWLYAHLGDFTAERGWAAALQVGAVSLAFGAMTQLIVEAAIRALLGLQNDLDALSADRKHGREPDDRG